MRKTAAGALFVALIASSALAVASATAGLPTNTQAGSKLYVSDFSGGTCSPLESNKIPANATFYAVSTQNIPLHEAIYTQGTSSNSNFVAGGILFPLSWQPCPGTTHLWWQVLGSLPDPGTYTLDATYLFTNKNFSNDSFQIVPAAG